MSALPRVRVEGVAAKALAELPTLLEDRELRRLVQRVCGPPQRRGAQCIAFRIGHGGEVLDPPQQLMARCLVAAFRETREEERLRLAEISAHQCEQALIAKGQLGPGRIAEVRKDVDRILQLCFGRRVVAREQQRETELSRTEADAERQPLSPCQLEALLVHCAGSVEVG